MAGLDFFYIISPESTTNLIVDGSFEVSTANTTVVGTGTRTRVTTDQKFDLYSMAVTPSSGTSDGMYLGSYTITSSLPYTFSIYGLWVNGVPYLIRFANTSGTLLGTATTWTGAGIWERKEVTYTPGTTTVRLYVTKNGSSSVAPYYLDGAQLEQKAYSTTYVNGDRPGCYWNGVAHASTSGRFANYRGGGKKINLSDYDAYVTDMTGVGTPEVEAIMLPYGYDPGNLYQGTLVKNRTMTIGVSVSAGNNASTASTDISAWHSNMEAIFNLLKPDVVYPQQPFVLGYQQGGNDVEIECVYTGGNELQNEKLKDISDITFQVQCPNPYWSEPTQSAALLTTTLFVDGGGGFEEIYARTTDGVWRNLTPGTNSFTAIYCMYIGPVDGKLYVGGSITTINGVSATNIAVYDFSTTTWSALGTGCNNIVRAIVQLDNGDIIAGGDFTSAGGVTSRCTARWNGSTWAVVGIAAPFTTTPITPSVHCLEVNPLTRNIMVGGVWGGAAIANGPGGNYMGIINVTVPGYTLSWDSSSNFYPLITSSGGTGAINVIKFHGQYMYFTGTFSSVDTVTQSPVTGNGIGRMNWFTSTNIPTFESIGTGFGNTTDIGQSLTIDAYGKVFLCGRYSTINGISIINLAQFDGYQWTAATDNATNIIPAAHGNAAEKIFFDNDGILHVNLNERSPSGSAIVTPKHTKLIGRRLVMGVATTDSGASESETQLCHGYNTSNGEIYIATNQRFLYYPSLNLVTNNGSANAYPVIKIKSGTDLASPSTVYYIKNNTNGGAIYFKTISNNLPEYEMTLRRTEIITIDTRIGRRGVTSNIRSSGFSLDDVTQLENFYLSPGVNNIELLGTISGGTISTQEVTITWNDTHWTFHGGHS